MCVWEVFQRNNALYCSNEQVVTTYVRSLVKPLYSIFSNTQVECIYDRYSNEVMQSLLQQRTSYHHILWTQLYMYLVISGHDIEEFGKFTYVKFNLNLKFNLKLILNFNFFSGGEGQLWIWFWLQISTWQFIWGSTQDQYWGYTFWPEFSLYWYYY